MVKFNKMRIDLKRSDETITYESDEYEEATFETTDNIDGSLPYLMVRANDGFGYYYPLEYWEIKITGEKV